MIINQTHAWSRALTVHREMRDLAYTLSHPDIEATLDELTTAAVAASAAAERLVYAPWDFHVSEADLDDRSAFEQLHTGAAANPITVFDSNAPMVAITQWAAPPEFLAETEGGARPSVLLTAWITMQGDLVPLPAVLVTDAGITYHANEMFGDDQEDSAQQLVGLGRLLSVEFTGVDAKASRKVRRSYESKGPTPPVVIRAAETAVA